MLRMPGGGLHFHNGSCADLQNLRKLLIYLFHLKATNLIVFYWSVNEPFDWQNLQGSQAQLLWPVEVDVHVLVVLT